jgi:CheY-like chemotaxis protein
LPEASATEALLSARHGGQRILLAEDNAVNREVAQELLGAVGLQVETAFDGARAAELALTRDYDLILMDVQMPVMDGLEATRAVRNGKGHATPIIAMTANAFAEDREACLASGMNDHVGKPVDPEALYAVLLKWLPLRAPVAPPRPQQEKVQAPPADSAGPSDMMQKLSRIDGLDGSLALRNVGNQPPALSRILVRFAEAYAAGLPVLLNTMDDERKAVDKWRAACHSIRGALGTIGATALARRMMDFEQELAAHGATRPIETFAPTARHLHEAVMTLQQRIATEFQPD